MGIELYDKKLGILGMGRLGQIVADYATSFGMQVLYYDIDFKEVSANYHRCSSIMELFSESDFVSIHIPYNPDTHHLVDTKVLNNAKKRLCIVNTSRGGVIDENALVKAMDTGNVSVYATDVLYGEPEIDSNPIMTYSKSNANVIITPHIGGYTQESIEKTERFILDKFLRLLSEPNHN
jgi:D-3-phosphoglycerate dehydrogenase